MSAPAASRLAGLILATLVAAPGVAQDTAQASADEPAATVRPLLDFAGLVAPFDQGFTAATTLSPDAMIVFHRDKSLLYDPATSASAPGLDLSEGIDAALRYNDATLMLFSGAEVFLIDTESAAVSQADPLSKLGLPESWVKLDAAAVYDETRWILFRGSEFVILQLPTAEVEAQVVGPAPLTGLALGDWSDGIDAAANMLDGRLLLFRGDGFRVLDTDQNTITAPAAFAPAAEATAAAIGAAATE